MQVTRAARGGRGAQQVCPPPHLTTLSPGLVFRCLRFVPVTQAAKASLGGCGAAAGRERRGEQPGLLGSAEPHCGFRGPQETSWGKRNFLRAVTFEHDWWGIGGGVPWALLMSPPASICSLFLMEMCSRAGVPGTQLSTHETFSFLNTLDTPA